MPPDGEDDIVQECMMWGTFIELRYRIPENPIATEVEQIAYDVHSFCGMIDSDGMTCLLSQPEAKLHQIFKSLRAPSLTEHVQNVVEASAALQKAGLSVENDNPDAISSILGPFEKKYYETLRKPAYERLLELINSSEVFEFYGHVELYCQQEELNIFDPKVWDRYR